MSDAQRAQVLALAGDFPALWNDPATPQRERKRMVRLLIDDVTLDKTDAIAIHVRLKGGQTATLTTPIPPRAWEARQTPPEVIAEIRPAPRSSHRHRDRRDPQPKRAAVR